MARAGAPGHVLFRSALDGTPVAGARLESVAGRPLAAPSDPAGRAELPARADDGEVLRVVAPPGWRPERPLVELEPAHFAVAAD